jgi:hypothetical protein
MEFLDIKTRVKFTSPSRSREERRPHLSENKKGVKVS